MNAKRFPPHLLQRSNPSATTRPTINRGGQAKNFRTCDGIPKHPIVGRDGSIQLLFREGVIQSIPTSLCGSKRGKNVILVIGDGMGWEMVRAGAIGKRVVDELTRLGCNVRNGCPNNQRARDAFAGRTLADYYTEGMSLYILSTCPAVLLLSLACPRANHISIT